MRALLVLFVLSLSSIAQATCCEKADCERCKYETYLIESVNHIRARHGLYPLQRDARLITGCRVHSRRQAARGGTWHARGGFSAECVASGQQSVNQVVSDWYHSSGHRAIMLGHYTYLGAGRVGTHWTLRTR